jgi:hypothetical protein
MMSKRHLRLCVCKITCVSIYFDVKIEVDCFYLVCTEPYQFIIQRYNPSYNQIVHNDEHRQPSKVCGNEE